MVAYGYRSLKIQQKYFNSEIRKYISKKKTSNKFSTFDYEQIHRIVAVPQVAGHPTGGAIDAILYNKKDYVSLPFGSNIYDFEPKYAYFNSPYIKEEFKKNRILLRSLLIKQGFAPYDGEWWHFSYGDPEWAFYYKKKYAIFCQVSPEKVKISLKINKTPPHDD